MTISLHNCCGAIYNFATQQAWSKAVKTMKNLVIFNEQRPVRGCLWPMWPHSARPTHEYCGDRKMSGASYCEAHQRLSIRDLETEPRQPFVRHKAA